MLNSNLCVFLARKSPGILIGVLAEELAIVDGFFKEFTVINDSFCFRLYLSILV